MAGIDTPGTTEGTVPGTVPGAVRKVVCDGVWTAVDGAILTGRCGTRREGIRSPAWIVVLAVTSIATGNGIGSMTGEVFQSAICDGTCGEIVAATCTAIPLVILMAPVFIQRRY